jgi:hypothetical protein
MNHFEWFRCEDCGCYLLSPQGDPNCQFRYDGAWLCADCDPEGCAECGNQDAYLLNRASYVIEKLFGKTATGPLSDWLVQCGEREALP